MATALIAIMWTYDGWADLSFMGGEVKDPARTLPLALILGTAASSWSTCCSTSPTSTWCRSRRWRAPAHRRHRRGADPAVRRRGRRVVSGDRDALLLRRAHRLDDDRPADLLRHGRPRPLLPGHRPGVAPVPEPLGGDLARHRARRASTSCSTTSSSSRTSSSWGSGPSMRWRWRPCSCCGAPAPTCRGRTAPGAIRWCRSCSCWRRWRWW